MYYNSENNMSKFAYAIFMVTEGEGNHDRKPL